MSSTLDQIDEIMRLASVMATARVRRYHVHSINYRGNETTALVDKHVDDATAALRAAVESLTPASTTDNQ